MFKDCRFLRQKYLLALLNKSSVISFDNCMQIFKNVGQLLLVKIYGVDLLMQGIKILSVIQ